VPHHTHEVKQPISVIKVVSPAEPRDLSPTFKEMSDFTVTNIGNLKNERISQAIKDDHFKDEKPSPMLVKKNEGRTTTF
jgi:hypothetical protein